MTAAELLSLAASAEGHRALALPSRPPGAVGPRAVALCRIGPGSIGPAEPIGQPDGLIVADPGLLRSDLGVRGLAPARYLLVNSTESLDELGLTELAVGLPADRQLTIPATELAQEHLSAPLPDTALVGGFVALSGVVSLTSVIDSIRERFRGRRMEQEVAVAEAAYGYVERELRRRSAGKQKEPAWTIVTAPIGRVPELHPAGAGERPAQERRRPA
jgi:pyruvate ferredoxin oxidoreductase gamma subunit